MRHRYDKDYIDSQNRLSARQAKIDNRLSNYIDAVAAHEAKPIPSNDFFQQRRNAYYELMTSYGMSLIEAQQQVEHNLKTDRPLWYRGFD